MGCVEKEEEAALMFSGEEDEGCCVGMNEEFDAACGFLKKEYGFRV